MGNMENDKKPDDKALENKIIKVLSIIIIILVILLLVQEYSKRSRKVKDDPAHNGKLITDTIYLNQDKYQERYDKIAKSFDSLKALPPRKVVVEVPIRIPGRIDSVRVLPEHVVFHIDSLKRTLKIANDFITRFEKSPKIVNFHLEWDKLSMATLNIYGEFVTHEYDILLDHYSYFLFGDKMRIKKRDKPVRLETIETFKQLYAKTGYEYIQGKPTIGLDYQLYIKRFRIQIDNSMIISRNPDFYGNITLGYRLIK